MAIASINPATGQLIKSFEPLTDAQIEGKLKRAAEAFCKYRRTSFAERARMMVKAGEILENDREKFARTMTTEMGKPFRAAVDEAVKCVSACLYYSENAERLLADEVIDTGSGR